MIREARTSRWTTLWVLTASAEIGDYDVALLLEQASSIGLPYTQLISPGVLVGPLHAVIASVTAYRRHSKGAGIAKSPSMELLLRLSGERQVSRAIRKLGIRPGSKKACIVAVSPEPGALQTLLREKPFRDIIGDECLWGGLEAAKKLYGFKPESCVLDDTLQCAEIHAASLALVPEVY